MTPHDADVAFVLESVEGVTAVYAIDPTQRVSTYFDYAVALETGGRVLAEAHYALLRVMGHEDCARVFLFHTEAPFVVAKGARLLSLTSAEREAARGRVPPPAPREPIVGPPAKTASTPPRIAVLLVDDDGATQRVVSAVLGPSSPPVLASSVEAAISLATSTPFDLVLCDAKRAFGAEGLLAKLPLDDASRVVVLATRAELVDARWRLQGIARIVSKPVKAWILRERIRRAGTGMFNPLWAPDLERTRSPVNERPRRRITAPPPSSPFTVLLADVDDDVHEILQRVVRDESRYVLRHAPDVAAEIALSMPLHAVLCSDRAALPPRNFLDAIAREDPAGADGVIVLALTRNVPHVKQKLAQMRRKNRVLALPLDETLLARELFRQHPTLVARAAAVEVAASIESVAAPLPISPPRYRRLAVLVVDDDATTQILFAAAAPHARADVSLATTPMQAFEQVVSRPVDLVVVSATMRSDSGEPFYRVLWRLKPELKTRCVLIAPADASPPSAAASQPPRIVERPLTREAIARIVDAFAPR